jgi:hypothetical protein
LPPAGPAASSHDQEVAIPGSLDESPAQTALTCADPAPRTVVELIYRLLSDTGNTIRTLTTIVVTLIVLGVVVHALKLSTGQIARDVTQHSVAYLVVSSFAGGGLLTGAVASAKKRVKKRNGSASGG